MPSIALLEAGYENVVAKVGGILANWHKPSESVCQNLQIETNVIGEAFAGGVQRLTFLGSSCIHPREAPRPLREECLLTGSLEETNRAYAMTRIAGIEPCRSLNLEHGAKYLSLMPTNLCAPGDDCDLQTSHVLPTLIGKFHAARMTRGPMRLWGSGSPLRESLHSS